MAAGLIPQPVTLNEVDRTDVGADRAYFDFINSTPYYVLVRFDWAESYVDTDPDLVIKPYTNQLAEPEGGADKLCWLPTDSYPVAKKPSETSTSLFGFTATNRRVRTSPATQLTIGVSESADVGVSEFLAEKIENLDRGLDYIIVEARVDGDAFNRVEITNTGLLYVGDGTAAPVGVGRVAGVDDLNDYLLLSGGSMSGNIGMGSTHRIINLPGPVNDGDATRKLYVDDGDSATLSNAQGYTDNRVQKLAADTFGEAKPPQDWPSGLISMVTTTARWFATGMLLHNSGGGGSPARFTQTLITSGSGKLWFRNAVDALTWGAWERAVMASGDTLTGELNVGNNKIVGLGAGTAAGNATRKDYVDDGDSSTLTQAKNFATTRTTLVVDNFSSTAPNGWTVDAGFPLVTSKLPGGLCYIEGRLRNTSGGTLVAGQVVAQISGGFQPLRDFTKNLATQTNADTWRINTEPVEFQADGQIVIKSGIADGDAIDFGGITYRYI